MSSRPLTITVYGTPAPQGSKRAFVNRHTGRPVVVDNNPVGVRAWRQDVKHAALAALEQTPGPWPLLGPVRVDIVFYLPRPKAHYRTGARANELRDNAPVYVDKKPDLDKLTRASCDALTEAGVFRDDAQIAQDGHVKLYTGGPWSQELPGATITVAALTAPTSSPPPAPDTQQVLL